MEYTSIYDVTAVEHPAADRASAYGLEPILIDGNDVDVVYRTAQRALDLARRGGGPSLIEAETYRHGGHSRADPGKYRPEEEVKEWLGQRPDPALPQAPARARLRRARARGDRDRSPWPRSIRRPRKRATRRRRRSRLPRRTFGPTEARHGATNLSRGRSRRHGAGNAPRPERRVPRRGCRGRGRRIQSDGRACSTSSGQSACAIRRSPSRRFSAPRWARR